MACELCYSLTFDCGDDILLDFGLSTSTDYTVLVQNNQTGLHYSYAVQSDGDGAITWPEADQPTALFVPFNGPFTTTILDTNGDVVTFTVGYDEYECAEFTITNTTVVTPTP